MHRLGSASCACPRLAACLARRPLVLGDAAARPPGASPRPSPLAKNRFAEPIVPVRGIDGSADPSVGCRNGGCACCNDRAIGVGGAATCGPDRVDTGLDLPIDGDSERWDVTDARAAERQRAYRRTRRADAAAR